jgi:hypothetical protein
LTKKKNKRKVSKTQNLDSGIAATAKCALETPELDKHQASSFNTIFNDLDALSAL